MQQGKSVSKNITVLCKQNFKPKSWKNFVANFLISNSLFLQDLLPSSAKINDIDFKSVDHGPYSSDLASSRKS
jgi:hypothetical protein